MKHALLTLIGAWTLNSSSTAQWSEDFEGNWITAWSADNGSWSVGSPTSGPNAAHTGSANCAGTVLDGNYPPNTDTRWIRHVDFLVPPASSNPRLRFWQWYSFSYADFGEVQISTDAGDTWTSAIPNYTWTGSEVWTRATVDLSPWSDSTIRIAFLCHAADYSGSSYGTDVSSGWYIDDIGLFTGPYVVDSLVDFESQVDDWYAERGTWEIGVPTSGPGSAHSDSSCAATVLAGNYAPTVDSRLVSPYFPVPESGDPSIVFWSWADFNYADWAEVHIRTDADPTWTLLSAAQQYDSDGPAWSNSYFSLSAFTGETVQVGFYFHAADYSGSSYGTDVSSGWYIDDVMLDIGTSIEQDKATKRLTAAPNPFTDQVVLKIPVSNVNQVIVTDRLGCSITSFSAASHNRITWNGRTTSGTEVPPGMYLVTVIADGQRYTQRVIKQ